MTAMAVLPGKRERAAGKKGFGNGMRKWNRKNRRKQSENGQSIVEFALILPILILLLSLPVDLYRYMDMKVMLSNAASESIGELDYETMASGDGPQQIVQVVEDHYGDRLDHSKVQLKVLSEGGAVEIPYTYYVYSSALADPSPANYWSQFESRAGNYQCAQVRLQLAYDMKPVTFWGSLFLGDSFEVKTREYSRNLYVRGYSP